MTYSLKPPAVVEVERLRCLLGKLRASFDEAMSGETDE